MCPLWRQASACPGNYVALLWCNMPRPSVLLSLVLIAAPAYPAARLTYIVHGAPVPVTWTSFPINYAVDRRVADAMGGVTQIDRAVAEWAGVPGAEIAFNDLGVRDGLA